MLAPAIVLNGRYQLTQRIAAGGMGEVWRGTDLLLHREIAVKMLLPALMADEEFITRFRVEARMMAALRHPGIVQVYDYGENAAVGNDRLDYQVMEFIDGTPLAKHIQRAGRLGPAETMTVVAQVADALQAAHQAGIIHRDVKPSNLLVRPAGAIVLVDFGVARSVGVTGLTSTNVVLGSAHYMAPEQAEGKPVSAATDVYALGAVAFSCLTGRPPHAGDNPLAVIAQLVHGRPPVLPDDIPPAVSAVVLRALAREPGQRFPSAAALAEAARAAAAYGPATPAPALGNAPPAPAFGGTTPAPAFRNATPSPALGNATPAPAFGGATPAPAFGNATPTPAFGAATQQPGAAPALGSAAPWQGFDATVPVDGATGGGGSSAPGDPPAPPGLRRRTVLAVAAGAVVLALAGTGVVLVGQPESSAGQTQLEQPANLGQDVPVDEGVPVTASRRATADPDKPKPPAPSPSKAGGATVPSSVTSTDPPTATTTPEPGTNPTATPTGSVTTTTAAPEPTNPYTPAAVCGAGFEVIDSARLRTSGGVLKGRVYLLYHAGNGKNCVVTMKATAIGKKTATAAFLEVKGKARKADSGSFGYYAGPVSAAAAATCVKWGGTVGAVTYASPFEHCG